MVINRVTEWKTEQSLRYVSHEPIINEETRSMQSHFTARRGNRMERESDTKTMLRLFLMGVIVQGIDACLDPCVCAKGALHCVNMGLKRLNVDDIPEDIVKLYLSRNGLTNEVLGGISKLRNVTVLDLSYNDITEVKDGEFQRTLKEIYLDNNRVTFAGQDPFAGTEQSLVRLSLRNNKIATEISTVTFYAHEKLEYLDLSANLIPSLEDNTVFPASLKYLNLSHNPISRIYYSSFKINTQLLILNLKWIEMKTMKSSYFKKCSSLRQLRLGGDHLTQLSSKTFTGLSAIEVIEISRSKITVLPSYVFENLPSLNTLRLISNTFNYFEESLFGNDSSPVKEFYLEKNSGPLVFQQSVFRSFRSVTHLSLRRNGLTSFPGYLDKKMPHLQFLDLSLNKITSLETPNTKFPDLIGLDISDNEISLIRDEFVDYFPNLQLMDISNNNLSRMTIDWATTSLVDILAEGNPWICDCSMKHAYKSNVTIHCNGTDKLLKDEFESISGNRKKLFCISCTGPPAYHGQKFSKRIANSLENCVTTTPTTATSQPSAWRFVYIVPVVVGVCIIIVILVLCVVMWRRNRTKVVMNDNSSEPNSFFQEHHAEASEYQGIEKAAQNYEVADYHVYHSIKAQNAEYEGLEANRKENSYSIPDATEEGAYIDPNLVSSGMTDRYDDTRMPNGPYSMIPDADPYNSLPTPPVPPGLARDVKSAYELDMTAKQRSPYLDFSNSQSESQVVGTAHLDGHQISSENGKASNAYELE